MSRISILQAAIGVARMMELRSEDPWNKVGAVALTEDNRIIATAYNGLLPGVAWAYIQNLAAENNADLREFRLPYMVHAEQNLCSLLERGRAEWAVTTLCPCPSCLILLAVHGIKHIHYLRDYERDPRTAAIAKFYKIELYHEQV